VNFLVNTYVVMNTLSRIVPPIEKIKDKESVIVVSNKKPPCVYVTRALNLIQKSVMVPSGEKRTADRQFQLELTGCGAAINRCEQICRYIKQQLLTKYKHFIKGVSSTKSKMSDIHVFDYSRPEDDTEENAFDLIPAERIE
jgi:hypothetical protein